MADAAMTRLTRSPMKLPFVSELALLAVGAAAFLLMPDELGFLTRIVISALFVLSLDLVVGYAGIPTLGHAAFYGVGAYAAGLFAIHVSPEPLTGLLVGGLIAASLAVATGPIILRARGLVGVMLTVAVAQILYEIANKARRITGGDDGLSGIEPAAIFGTFSFDFYGRTGFVYCTIVLVVAFAIMRRITSSPFGLTCIGIREDMGRMSALGTHVKGHLLTMYTLSGFFAGVAGALSAQTVQVVGLSSLSFAWSAEALVMLVLGGMGRLWGALLGAILFMIVHHYAAAVDPFRWMFVIGAMLIAVVLIFPKGLIGTMASLAEKWGARK